MKKKIMTFVWCASVISNAFASGFSVENAQSSDDIFALSRENNNYETHKRKNSFFERFKKMMYEHKTFILTSAAVLVSATAYTVMRGQPAPKTDRDDTIFKDLSTSSPANPGNAHVESQHDDTPQSDTMSGGTSPQSGSESGGSAMHTTFGTPSSDQDVAKEVPQALFFNEIMGISEDEFKGRIHSHFQKLKQVYNRKSANAYKEVEKVFPPPEVVNKGSWHQLTIENLRKITDTLQPPFTEPGFVKILEYADVRSLQGREENRGALFQVASNFNGEEGTARKSISGIADVYLQGQQARIAVGGSAIKLYYYMPPIDLLREVSHARSAKNYEEITQKIAIGLHQDIQVTNTVGVKNRKNNKVITDPRQTVSQVLTSALSDHSDVKMSQAFLDAAYEGTLRAAVHAGCQKVFLTLVGGGVFQNRFEWIARAIDKMKDFIKNKKLQVHVIFWPKKDGQDEPFRQKIQEIAAYVQQ